jgi:hypothetical protein
MTESTGANLQAAEPRSARVRVMTFNIWLGGDQIDFDQVAAAIRAADADIVGIQEPGENLPRLAEALGWHSAAGKPRHGRGDRAVLQPVLSRHPIVDGPDPETYVYVRLGDLGVMAVANVHLSAYPYAPHDLRDGATIAEALELEQQHLHELAHHFEALPKLAADQIPVLLTGDFNVPSHLDWTTAPPAAGGGAGRPAGAGAGPGPPRPRGGGAARRRGRPPPGPAPGGARAPGRGGARRRAARGAPHQALARLAGQPTGHSPPG